MSLYQKKLEEIVEEWGGKKCPQDIIRLLFRIGVIDSTLVKVLVIREYVHRQVETGVSKLNAMWNATELFACTYEYVRKCVYYYKDINIL